jgi:hypothetical protein
VRRFGTQAAARHGRRSGDSLPCRCRNRASRFDLQLRIGAVPAFGIGLFAELPALTARLAKHVLHGVARGATMRTDTAAAGPETVLRLGLAASGVDLRVATGGDVAIAGRTLVVAGDGTGLWVYGVGAPDVSRLLLPHAIADSD